MTIKYEHKTLETPTKTIEWIEATFDDSEVKMSIPLEPANSDYQRYLRWLENPNEVEHLTEIVADETPTK